MSKKKIIIISTICILCLSIGVIFAAFIFNQVVSNNADVGNIHLLNQKFISYAPQDIDPTNYNGGKASKEYLDAIKERDEANDFAANSVTCYATEREGYSEEEIPQNNNYMYLNQLGFEFSFYADVPVYVRIRFDDAWIRIKTYNGNSLDPEYILKGRFDIPTDDENWVFDEESNTYNYKVIVKDTTETTPFTGTFNLDDDYFYTSDETLTNGHLAVLVQVAFSVEIIQANRAYKLWHYDPSTL